MRAVIDTLVRDPETGMVLVVIGSSAQFNPELAVAPIIDAVAAAGPSAAPVMAFPLPHAPESLEILDAARVPAFRSVTSCAETIAVFLDPIEPAQQRDAFQDALIPGITTLEDGPQDEVTSSELMRAIGVPGPRSILLPADDVPPQDLGMVWPVVAKLVSADLPHKTDAGAIQIGIADRAGLIEAIARMKASAAAHAPHARIRGSLVQEMCHGLGEALIGIIHDPVAGPMVTLAMGGVMTEIYRDSAVRPAPVDLQAARAMVAEVKGFALLSGYRNRPKGDLAALAQAVVDVSRLAMSPRIREAEINPLLVRAEGEGVVMLDALVRL